ncbi:MAG TPA: sigma-70 family RNA polymerase sigma factor [Tepidisphaeraceae bacterium]|nr:sigma-70 family RNA polymerase sigma factor [Tepidisphaeraceae bacterium]
MAKYRIDSLGGLARQLTFTPQDVRLTQLAAAEELLHTIESATAYPLDFLIFRITGYHPKIVPADLLAGSAVQHDLGLLIEQVSESLDLFTAQLAEPVLQIEDVSERFNVTSKTIQRWRRKGLPARRFTFADGKRRLGFLLSSVERFFSAHVEQVSRGMNFSQIDAPEREEILHRARRLASACGCCQQEISRRIARRLNRSPATILHTIRKHDAEHANAAIFPNAAAELTDAERQKILKGHRRGLGLRALARRTGRRRSAVYRVILEDRLDRLGRRKMKFIDDELYHQADSESVVSAIVAAEDVMADRRPEDARVPRDLPPYLADLYRTPLLSAARERALFLQFNFYKFRFLAARRRIEPNSARMRDVRELEQHLRQVTAVKNAIVQANLRLVVSVARKHLRPGLALMELISDGNLTLMRAVEGFDAHRGHRFSTYATLALMKGFARSVPQMLAARAAGTGGPADSTADRSLDLLADPRPDHFSTRLADHDLLASLLGRLTDRERTVLLARYDLPDASRDDRAVSIGAARIGADTHCSDIDRIALRMGLSSSRVRDLEKRALAKLRLAAAELD